MLSSLVIFIMQSLFFSLAIKIFFKSNLKFSNALILFWVTILVKVIFAIVWVIYQTGVINFNYLQFPDEAYYLNYVLGDPFPNAYAPIVYFLQNLGFDILNLKYLNMLLTSFALVRLYSLGSYVINKKRYLVLLFFIGGIAFLHVTYYSIFLLKDSFVFLILCELLIQLLTRPLHRKALYIFLLIGLLVLFRKPLIMFLAIFLFDPYWRFMWRRFFISLPIVIPALVYLWPYFINYVSLGVYYNLNVGDERVKELVGVGQHFNLILYNLKATLSPFHQIDITNKVILSLELISILFIGYRARSHFYKFFPILMVPVLHFIFGVVTYYNIRYNLSVVASVIFVLIFYVSGVDSRLNPKWNFTIFRV